MNGKREKMLEIENFNPIRYSEVKEKNLREIVMLRGNGCKWRKCRFCDYHLDSTNNEEENYILNKEQLKKVTGKYHKLEVINSGSFIDLDEKTMNLIEKICIEKQIKQVHFECHWNHRASVKTLKERFAKNKIDVIVKIGVESFDFLFRESYLVKGIDARRPEEIAKYFDEVCLLQGIPGQTKDFMIQDIETGLKYFQRVCVNIMQENGKPIKPDPRVIKTFIEEVYPIYKNNERVDILLENTAFGVGGVVTHE